MLTRILEILPDLASPLAILALLCIIGAWLLHESWRQSSGIIQTIVRSIPKRALPRFAQEHCLNELERISKPKRLIALLGRYCLIAFVVAVVAVVFLLTTRLIEDRPTALSVLLDTIQPLEKEVTQLATDARTTGMYNIDERAIQRLKETIDTLRTALAEFKQHYPPKAWTGTQANLYHEAEDALHYAQTGKHDPPDGKEEAKRLLEEAKDAISNGKLSEADLRLDLLEKSYPHLPEEFKWTGQMFRGKIALATNLPKAVLIYQDVGSNAPNANIRASALNDLALAHYLQGHNSAVPPILEHVRRIADTLPDSQGARQRANSKLLEGLNQVAIGNPGLGMSCFQEVATNSPAPKGIQDSGVPDLAVIAIINEAVTAAANSNTPLATSLAMQATSTLGSPQLPNRSSFDYQFISQIPRQLQTQFSQSPGLQAPRQPFLYIAGLGGVLAPIPANTQPNSQGITSQPASTITIQAEITSMLFNDANGIIAYVVGPQLGGDLKVALADFVYSNQQCLSQIDNSSLTSTWSNIQSSILQTAPSFTNWDLFQTPYGCAYDSGYIFTALTNAEYLAHFAPSDLLDFGHHYAMATLSELEMALNTCYLTNFSVFTNNEVSMRAELLTANLLLQASLLANDYQTAISTIQRLETVAPVNASTYWALANLYFQLAETDFGTPESVVSYKHAIQKLVYLVGTDDTNAMWTLASCYESLANSYLYIPNRPAAIQCAKMAADTWWNLWLQTSNGMAAFNSFQERDYASGVLPVKANLPFVRGSVHELPRLDKRLSVKILE